MVFRDSCEVVAHALARPTLLEHPGIGADAGTRVNHDLSLGHDGLRREKLCLSSPSKAETQALFSN